MMAGNRTYSVSNSSRVNKLAMKTTTAKAVEEVDMDGTEILLCSCERLINSEGEDNIIKGSSSTSKNSSFPSSSLSFRKSVSSLPTIMRRGMLITLIFMIVVSHLTCCVSAWPMPMELGQRRSFSYAPSSSVVLPSDYSDWVDAAATANGDDGADQWAMAAQPMGSLDAYYDQFFQPQLSQQQQQQQQQRDVYDELPIYEDIEDNYPYFGPILNSEPEEELELEELKHEQPYVYNKRKISLPTKKPASTTTTTAAPTGKVVGGSSPAGAVAKSSTETPVAAFKKSAAPVMMKLGSGGQKEIPMLRPPSSSPHKSHLAAAVDEPEIAGVAEDEENKTVVQRSPSNEKPSAYDRLRKYLSIDDALKKEYQQRRAAASATRHQKRSSIITDSDSLTGQLNSLKKRMD